MKKVNTIKLLKRASVISKAIEAEAEEILEDAELAVKATTPACSQTKALSMLEDELNKEGVEALFDKKVSRIAMAKTASEALSDEELKVLVKKIVKAIVDEFEDVLKDADEICDEDCDALVAADDEEDVFDVEGKLKNTLEKKLAAKGIYATFERKHKVEKNITKTDVVNNFKSMRSKRNK